MVHIGFWLAMGTLQSKGHLQTFLKYILSSVTMAERAARVWDLDGKE